MLLGQYWCILWKFRVMYKHLVTKSQRNRESQWLSDRIRSWLNNPEIIILSQTTVWFTPNNYECSLTSSSVSSSGNMEIYVKTLKTWLRILIQFVFLMSPHWSKLFLLLFFDYLFFFLIITFLFCFRMSSHNSQYTFHNSSDFTCCF